jgi:hypothetical protein
MLYLKCSCGRAAAYADASAAKADGWTWHGSSFLTGATCRHCHTTIAMGPKEWIYATLHRITLMTPAHNHRFDAASELFAMLADYNHTH